MVETVLRQLNLELLRQLWVGQDAVRRSVAKASSESSLDSSISSNSETPSYQETCSTSSRTYCPRDPLDAFQTDPRDMTRPGLSRAASLPPAKSQHQQYLGRPRPHSAPLPTTSDLNDPEPVAGLNDLGLQKAQVLRSLEARQSKPSKPRVTFCEEQSEEESAVPEKSWRLRPYLGYDWIAGSLDNTSPVSSKPDAFFSKLQKFRESNEEECVYSRPRSQLLGLHEGTVVEDDHECVYCYRVNRRLFLVPVDPGTPCRLCRTSRDQQGPKTLKEPAQVRVSIPLSILDPPHRYRVHRRKSFDASDTLALPRVHHHQEGLLPRSTHTATPLLPCCTDEQTEAGGAASVEGQGVNPGVHASVVPYRCPFPCPWVGWEAVVSHSPQLGDGRSEREERQFAAV
ncbi:migration and invasion-inhibitory protein isoform X1 [Tupaia chinensis]|uniref:migration and invasion-inhibitory protein isoform X1 n=1 Tax=Tupaia chinensis TaxID=246437 RepID=UPI000FFB1573|nr:migration and invasion-inhibitory protein isoform X1 [Tupaia chinensis]XP_027626429.1 migration and invasion-inhibitory protein isoform X1 [Tupaia chinensis]XP_027626430.1 migration and invasion-inhibitory protein isoform X1 [Tupaia chinensis]XP_027626431.1 migration and invasion-inhibitory protein isoform X1 [Tupaia chinensis]XP_027626432.1 migration and invasion-inhibitory protein isoform X1 [Tupaia chinensis]